MISKPVGPAALLAVLLTISACAGEDLHRLPPPEGGFGHGTCAAYATPTCKIGNSSRVRSSTQVVSCRCDRAT